MALKYKIGDKVRIKSLDWYNENKDGFGDVKCGGYIFAYPMTKLCGKTVNINCVNTKDCYYVIYKDGGYFIVTDEMIECLVEDNITDIDKSQDDNETIDIIDEYVHRLKGSECQIDLPEGYQFTDEDGNIINTTKIILEKKNKYPKTYEECIGKLPINWDGKVEGYKYDLLTTFQKLLICRDVYWKIAGKEMGLGKPWEPDWKDGSVKYVITYDHNEIYAGFFNITANRILSFPTEEMRYAFYENFKGLIEQCKELL